MTGALSNKTAPVRFLIVTLLIALFLPACLKIKIPPGIYPPRPGERTGVAIEISGPEADRSDFAHAYAVSKIYRTRVENETGSLRDLLLPAVFDLLKNPQIHLPSGSKLTIQIEKSELFWIPPREFIETPTPVKAGEVTIHFEIKTELTGTGEKKQILPTFTDIRSVRAFPGTETEVMSDTAYRSLCAYTAMVEKYLLMSKNDR